MGTTALREKHKGTSAFGGRYAAHERLESDIALAQPSTSPVPRLSPTDALTDAEALRTAKFLANRALYNTGIDTDDIAQEALLSVLSSQNRGSVEAITPGLIASATRNAVSHHLSAIAGVRQGDYAARQKLAAKAEAIAHGIGRDLTVAEFDELAISVRDHWHDQRHKPTHGYHEVYTEVDLDGEGIDAYDLPALTPTPGGGHQRAHDLADDIDAGRIDKTRARRAAWNAIAADLDVPEVVNGSVTESRARGYVKVVGDAEDGALGIAGRYLDGISDNPSTDAFFAPFGHIGAQDRIAIALALTARPQFADRLWRAALDAANARNN